MAASLARFYPIGTPGQAWGAAERATWLAAQKIQRSYSDEVVKKIDALRSAFDVTEYGRLSHGDYPLFAVKTKNWDVSRPNILITGGVHGYETSGVQVFVASPKSQR
jgi:hypothetical protein